MSLTPIINAGILYVNNCQVAQTGNAACTIAAGQVRDSTNTFDIVVPSTLTVGAGNVGLNGIDTGTLAASTFYAVYVIADATGFNPVASIVSTSFSGPLMPFGYSIYRRLGVMLTNSSSHFLPFWVSGLNSGKSLIWDVPIRVLNAGTATSLTEVSLAGGVPNISTGQVQVLLTAAYTPNSASNIASFTPFGSSATAGLGTATYVIKSPSAAQMVVPFSMNSAWDATNSYQAIQYGLGTSDSLTLYVNGFVDQL